MSWIDLLKTLGSSFLWLAVIFLPIEWAFPAKARQGFFRKHWLLDLSHMVGQYLIWNGLVMLALDYSDGTLKSIVPLSFQEIIRSQPFWIQFLEVILISDFLIYWAHRWQHNNAFLWRFHKVHHSAKHMDWLAAHREHPLDTIYTVGLINLPAVILGFPLETIFGFIFFRGIWAIYIHSNVRLPLGPLKFIIGSPELHHWHHDRDKDAGNYGNLSPLMDLLFGTHTCPDHEPEAFGINEEFPDHYVGQMIEPMLPNGLTEKLKRSSPEESIPLTETLES